MSDEKINAFPALTDGQVADDTRLIPIGLASTGKMSYGTVSQQKKAYATKATLYTAIGTEGSTITTGAPVAGRNILYIVREGNFLYPTISSPDSTQYTWDNTNIGLGMPVSVAGERFMILHNSY